MATETSAQPTLPAAYPVEGIPFPFTVSDLERMERAGIFLENGRIELIDGEIVQMAAIGVRHMETVNRLNEYLVTNKPRGVTVSVQNSIRLSDRTLPMPDIALIAAQRYTALPGPADIRLVIEVSDSTYNYDVQRKLPRYAAAGVPEVWIVDLTSDTLERHTDPHDGRYHQTVHARRGEVLPSTTLPALTLPVDTVLD